MKTFSSLAQKPNPEVKKERKETFWKKIGPSVLGITLAVVVSGSIPFVKAHYKTLEDTVESAPVTLLQPPASSAGKLDNIEPFVWTARLKVEDFKLHHRLKLDSDMQSRIEISGSISPEEEARWNDFLSWYDTKQGFPKLISKVTVDAVSGNIPELKSVWFNEKPIAYFQDGSFGEIGSILQDGWEITNIEAWAVLVERDGATVSLNYN